MFLSQYSAILVCSDTFTKSTDIKISQCKSAQLCPYPRDLTGTNTYISGRAFFEHFRKYFHYIHTQLASYWRCGWWWQIHIHATIPSLDCLHEHKYTSYCALLSHLQELLPNRHAALHSTCVLISPVWG